jgi:hypothetical protein
MELVLFILLASYVVLDKIQRDSRLKGDVEL